MPPSSASATGVQLTWYEFAELPPLLLYEALRFRQSIFVVEQASPYPDLDGLDLRAGHLLLRAEGMLAGYLRFIPPSEEPQVRIGRVAVGGDFRRRGFARQLVAEALRRQRREYPEHAMILGAQTYLEPFYESLGFITVSAPYEDFGVPHIDMRHAPAP